MKPSTLWNRHRTRKCYIAVTCFQNRDFGNIPSVIITLFLYDKIVGTVIWYKTNKSWEIVAILWKLILIIMKWKSANIINIHNRAHSLWRFRSNRIIIMYNSVYLSFSGLNKRRNICVLTRRVYFCKNRNCMYHICL